MKNDEFKILLQGYIDGELSPAEQEQVQREIEDSPECRAIYREFLAFKNFTTGIQIKTPDGMRWENYMNSLYARIERGTGWILFSLGAIILLSYGAYAFITSLIKDSDVPLLVKTGIFSAAAGLVILFVSIIRERILDRKTDVYKEIRK